jgi:anti-anti-sigma factor
MEIKNFTQEGHIIVELSGNLDSVTVSQAEEKIVPLICSKACMVMDLTKCNYISSAGLRLLLMVAKQLTSQGGWLTLAGLCEEIKDVMEMTGFSCFFKSYSNVPEAIEAIRKGL